MPKLNWPSLKKFKKQKQQGNKQAQKEQQIRTLTGKFYGSCDWMRNELSNNEKVSHIMMKSETNIACQWKLEMR